jgi:hypothetical protein
LVAGSGTTKTYTNTFGNKVTYLSTTPADVGFTTKERVASVRTQLNF